MLVSEKQRANLDRAKTIMGKIDPALLSSVLHELVVEADEAEGPEVAKIKASIKKIYDSIPEGKNKTSIISKAIAELNSDITEKEIKAIKVQLAGFDKETIWEAAKDFVDIQKFCTYSIFCSHCVNYYVMQCQVCVKHAVPCLNCLSSAVHCLKCVTYMINCPNHCLSHGIPTIPDWRDWENPWKGNPLMDDPAPILKEQLKAEIIQELLKNPELSRAMKKMLQKIGEEKKG